MNDPLQELSCEWVYFNFDDISRTINNFLPSVYEKAGDL